MQVEEVYKQLGLILHRVTEIEKKLDRIIKAIQEHDELDENFESTYDEYGARRAAPCVGHDQASWEEEMNERMDVIGQNGNEGLHYDMEKINKAVDKWSEKRTKEAKEYLKGATFKDLPDSQPTPPPPTKPKKKYYHNKKKKDVK